MQLYFRDNFFNAGLTDIRNDAGEPVGQVDLRSAFGSALDIYGRGGNRLYGGQFPLLSNRWTVMDGAGEECGELRQRMSFFSKHYEYDAYGRGVYEITSPAFSGEYEVTAENGMLAASFRKVSGWLEPSAYCLDNRTSAVDSFEWIAVVLGMHEIQKRRRNASM
ncbi:hypothetical protein [Paenibacillus cymbidii]|uniref:hypothetical protein n=1 Tax=Paenibacillus cymbidii TaxID=1639034 RepID=UPI001080D40A|nr:hypothetical protein [Paenibacillus cymbidii]